MTKHDSSTIEESLMKDKSIKEIKSMLENVEGDLSEEVIREIKQDTRKGVQTAWEQWCKRKKEIEDVKNRYIEMSKFEKNCCLLGYHKIAGVDEVGRGPLAGPVVASAVILDSNSVLFGLDDSKKLKESKREELYERIIEKSVAIGVGIVSAADIDRLNIYEASKVAMMKAIDDLPIQADYLLIDAMKLEIDLPQESIIKGDARSNSIAAASIIAKVTRDRYMKELDTRYPQYSFKTNVGYGTSQHLEAMDKYGITLEHRKSFAPVAELDAKQLTLYDDK
jgi:ribonuclease HII